MKIYRFDDCLLNSTERRVLKNGKLLDLKPKAFDVLLMLVEKGGEIVTKDEILGSVWNGSFVEEGNLAVQISKLRKTLCESPNKHYIETVQGNGYRFVSAVTHTDFEEWSNRITPQKQSLVTTFTDNYAKFSFDSIAVLPLDNECGNAEMDYLADGLTESFINSLSHISSLKVISRNTVFRYKNKDVNIEEIGKMLGVATILTGRIRLVKERLMFSVELTKTADGTQLWGKQFNQSFSDIIEVQEQIIAAVSDQLESEIKNISKSYESTEITNNPESYKYYLMGRYLYDIQTFDIYSKAVDYFQKAVLFDPNNVHAYVGIVNCHFSLYFFDQATFEETKLRIKPLLKIISRLKQDVDLVQILYGKLSMHFDKNFEKAEKNLCTALKINPNSVDAMVFYIDNLIYTKRYSEARKFIYKMLELDFMTGLSFKRAAKCFFRMEDYEQAMFYLQHSLKLEPMDYQTLTLIGSCLVAMGDFENAYHYFHRSLNLFDCVETLSLIGYSKALENKKDEAYRIINEIKATIDEKKEPLIHLAKIYAGLKENEIAMEYLNQAYKRHETDLILLTSDPRWKNLHNVSSG